MNTGGTDQQADKLAAALRLAGLRVTAQRVAVLQVISATQDHPDVEELYRRAKATDPKTSIATVYRTVSVLVQAGMIQRHVFEGASARYERVDKQHHDHIVDLDTGDIFEFQSDRIERMQADIALRMGFDVIHHRLELYCRKRPSPT